MTESGRRNKRDASGPQGSFGRKEMNRDENLILTNLRLWQIRAGDFYLSCRSDLWNKLISANKFLISNETLYRPHKSTDIHRCVYADYSILVMVVSINY